MKSRKLPSEPFGLEAWLEKSRIVLPLRGLSVRADITAGFADVEVDQLFEQNNDQPLDCRFLFPLPADAATYRCEMRVNGRVVSAKTEQRDEARKLFKQAKARGRRAALTESERDNLFTLSLGNLQPGDIVLMRFAYLQPVQRLRERRTLRIPVNPGVRYISGEPLLRENSGPGTVDDTDLVPDASRITPPRIAGDHPDAASLHASVRLRAAGDFTDSASSPSHPIVIKKDGDDLVAALAIDGHLPNRDFVFTWNEKCPTTPVVRAWLDENNRGLLEIRLPEAPANAATAPPPDVYFLLDRSGSMGGDNWTGACKALAAFVPRLHPETRVWLSLFESTVRDYESKLICAADIDFGAEGSAIHRIGVDGGTELVPALQHLGSKMREHSAEHPAAVLVITDGQVGDERGAIAAAKKFGCPVHILGVAMTANDGLDAIAKQTGGRSIFLAPGEDIAGAVERFAPILRAPVVTGLTMPPGWTTADESALRDLCESEDVVVPISASKDARDLDVDGRTVDGTAWSIVPERHTMPKAGLVWARSRIRSLDASDREDEALILAKEFNLLSSDAAYIAWDEAEQVPVAQTEIVQPAIRLESNVGRGYAACCAPPDVRHFSVSDGDDLASYRAARPGPRKRGPGSTRRRLKKDSLSSLLFSLPFAVVTALIGYLTPKDDIPELQPELLELVERLRQLIDLLYPGHSYPHEVRDALERIQTILATLEKSGDGKQAKLQEEAVDQLERLLQSLREHSRQRQQEMHENARRFADLEHTAARLTMALQEEVVRAKQEVTASIP